ncbi:sensor histidine kinase [Corynebacterium hadale]|uniref:sensor histidine kinase n=2 Tax=Corynebacterium TaxID=1716 RepID=UPI0013FD61ED|nr:histidine kinase [Corynebacterium hadale]
MNRVHLHLLDSILVFATMLYLNFASAALAREEVLFAVALLTVAAWVAWRKTEHKAAAVVFSLCAFAVFATANNPISILVLWCAVVALHMSLGKRAAYLYAGAIVVASFLAQLKVQAPVSKVAIETLSGAAAAAAGLNLASTVARQRWHEARQQDMAMAKERERIAATLHDALGHRLTTIGLSLDYALRIPDAEKRDSEIARARASVSEALHEMRATVRAMKPAAHPDEDIESALSHLAESFASTSLEVQFTHAPHTTGAKHSTEERMLMLHFCQEALTNVLRHSHATKAQILLDHGSLAVVDNGTGMAGPEAFGITSLRERAAGLGGEITTLAHGGIDRGFRIELHLKEKS